MNKNDIYIGMKFNRLTIRSIFIGENNKTYANCECDCGSFKVKILTQVKNGYVKSCGCLQKEKASEKAIDITGNKYGRLTVLGKDFEKGGHYWLCECECGEIKSIPRTSLVSGNSRSCGCLHKETARDNLKSHITKHGQQGTKLYTIWTNMKIRCYNPNSSNYIYYGGRGIQICQQWKDSFTSFFEWANTNGYVEGLSIERINVNGDYEPSNCKWIPLKEQALNKRRNILIEVNGVNKTFKELSNEYNIPYSTLTKRYRKNNNISLEELLKS